MTVGVIGGMGPEATVDFMRRVLAAMPAQDDAEHLHMIVDCNPQVPSRIRALLEGGGEDPGPVLAGMARRLQAAGARVLVMPCNTAHHYLPQVLSAVTIPVLDMVELAARALSVAPRAPRRIGLLASPAVRRVGLYDAWCAAAGLELVHPDAAGESRLLQVIRAVKAGSATDAERASYARAAADLVRDGAQGLLIACTEFSVLGPPDGVAVPVVDALDELVRATVRAC